MLKGGLVRHAVGLSIWRQLLTRAVRNLTARHTSSLPPEDGSEEVSRAREADLARKSSSLPPEPTIFSRILSKEIPADIIHEDEKVKYKKTYTKI